MFLEIFNQQSNESMDCVRNEQRHNATFDLFSASSSSRRVGLGQFDYLSDNVFFAGPRTG
jgi:hypothetical protein